MNRPSDPHVWNSPNRRMNKLQQMRWSAVGAKPVFVAPRASKPIERFLIAYDGSTSSMEAVDHVARSPLFAGLQCRLLSVGGRYRRDSQAPGRQAILKGGGWYRR